MKMCWHMCVFVPSKMGKKRKTTNRYQNPFLNKITHLNYARNKVGSLHLWNSFRRHFLDKILFGVEPGKSTANCERR